MEKLENLDEMEPQANLEHLEIWVQLDERDMPDLSEFQDTQDQLEPSVNGEMLVDQDFQEKTEDLDLLELKDQ